MTPAEHIAAAEQSIADGRNWMDQGEDEFARTELLSGILHALIAIAVESGVPHQTTAPVVG
jgi:hypothetical protein